MKDSKAAIIVENRKKATEETELVKALVVKEMKRYAEQMASKR